ncbi:MAG: cadmium-translocating P-type ATPase [Betaproteobacteria bacterium]|nr:cadmium-translocating P-type ATPase [Betaproteobacteria bacterium]
MTAEASCFHCGLPVAAGGTCVALVDGQRRIMCCPGCKAVAEAIVQGGLSSYYGSRTAYALRAEQRAAQAALRIYDRPEVQSGFARSLGGHERETTLILEGITCAACVWLNERHLAGLPGVLSAEINYATRRAHVRWDDSRIRLSAILGQVESIGYRAWPATSANAEQARRRETRAALWQLFVAGFGMMQVMMYALPAYLADEGSMSEDVRLLMRLASLLLTVPVVFFSAAPFFRGAWRDLRRRKPGMDVPVALGIGVAFGASLYATFTRGTEVYYDSITMFVFFLLCARWFEMRARQKAAANLEYLDKALPLAAHRLRDFARGMETEEISAISLRACDLVLVRAGENFPGDGNVVQGDTECDESLLTGESTPVRKRSGERISAGSFNRLSPVVVRITHVGEDTCVSGVRRLAERASTQRPRIAELTERVASRFVVGVLIFATAAAMLWLWVDASRALWVAVAVLVVSCPCALSLATPTVMTVAVGRLARRGVVIVRANAIEALAGVTHVVFDKTGTLTEGRFSLVAAMSRRGVELDRALAIAAALERDSEHPIATALAAAATSASAVVASAIRNVPGSGIEGSVDGLRHRLGSLPFVAEIAGALHSTEPDCAGATRVWLGCDDRWLACFDLMDQLRPEAESVVQRLQADGKHVLIWSGDATPAVGTVARQLGVDAYEAGLLPLDKQARMLAMQQQGAVVGMVGDGVNDAPVLAQAQLSIAMGSGALLTQAHADIVLLSGRLQGLIEAIGIAAQARRIVRQNLVWATAYNVVALSFAAAGLFTPWLAGIGMGASSLIVVLNALRVREVRREAGGGRREASG